MKPDQIKQAHRLLERRDVLSATVAKHQARICERYHSFALADDHIGRAIEAMEMPRMVEAQQQLKVVNMALEMLGVSDAA